MMFVQLTNDEALYIQRIVLKEATALHLEISRHKQMFPGYLQDKDFMKMLKKKAFDCENILRKCVVIPEESKEIGGNNNGV